MRAQVVVLTSRPLAPLYGEASFNGTLGDLLPELSARGLRHVCLDGGNVVRQDLQQQLADELTLSWIPATTGKGVRLFEGDMSLNQWKLTGHQAFQADCCKVVIHSTKRCKKAGYRAFPVHREP